MRREFGEQFRRKMSFSFGIASNAERALWDASLLLFSLRRSASNMAPALPLGPGRPNRFHDTFEIAPSSRQGFVEGCGKKPHELSFHCYHPQLCR
ncbi:hypothetical protein F3P66_26280 (plasmid) [Agrobacterium fabrum]|uniref:Uncharacterized protein n=5 Tax=Rhizobium/Agrobacterium group TaxID=227290 RepID=A9CKU2_AGRFC|nr:hypothetical protein Atu6159 [Agrobacterium fabrum str. C58]ASK42335.1 hypothetical protein [Agrobacterium sp.]ASK43362.1 hypothetical protein [Agrobacterium fabrum]ASK43622.1 hypothetical protein [Agrobacterium radiobacter]ASK43966.1 hypothetical protein [Rhizobium rhizogenes]ASK44591.1 hypothetical protein [Agrobacterium tumefaciens]ASK46060.1 hypothetical protein [Agrobacterium rubi]AYD05068.1 hypothetical protein NCHU2750_56992 [Neorhizobium sp. NCHU2750]